jgi:hypothetical protein
MMQVKEQAGTGKPVSRKEFQTIVQQVRCRAQHSRHREVALPWLSGLPQPAMALKLRTAGGGAGGAGQANVQG